MKNIGHDQPEAFTLLNKYMLCITHSVRHQNIYHHQPHQCAQAHNIYFHQPAPYENIYIHQPKSCQLPTEYSC
jgi:hypothetical protein